ncbi:MAG TPA: hypothetical protein VND15_00920 [Candidatus Acidoferrales bacterium]|nr:hypothetical protein [Candidatus Acidoferrales bacterium]
MNKAKMFAIIKTLPFDKKMVVYEKGDLSIYLLRPSKLKKRFASYNVKKNFQIWLKEGDREFKPNHMRLFIDLNLRIRSKPQLKDELLTAFDSIFYGQDPEKELTKLNKTEYEHSLNPITVIGILAQLFIIEQEYNYRNPSNFNPSTLFFQGWVREFIDNPKEIDNLCMSVANGQPPLSKYTNLENKKGKKYTKNLKPLWYLSTDVT